MVNPANLNRHTQIELEIREKESVVANVTFFMTNIHQEELWKIHENLHRTGTVFKQCYFFFCNDV
jgi:hypothetical protein